MTIPHMTAPLGSASRVAYEHQQTGRLAMHAYFEGQYQARLARMSPEERSRTEAAANEVGWEILKNMAKLLCPLGSLAMLIGGAVTCANDLEHSDGVGWIVTGGICTSAVLAYLAKKIVDCVKKEREERRDLEIERQIHHQKYVRESRAFTRSNWQRDIWSLQRKLQQNPDSHDRPEIELMIRQLQNSCDKYDRQQAKEAAERQSAAVTII